MCQEDAVRPMMVTAGGVMHQNRTRMFQLGFFSLFYRVS